MNLGCQTYASGKEFVDAYDSSRPGCVVLELRIPGADGMQVQKFLNPTGGGFPVIFLTAYPDLSIAVEAMRAGAVNFLEKPARSRELWTAIEEAIELDCQRRQVGAWRQKLSDRLGVLTPKEREVLWMIGKGKASKEIASALQVTMRAVQKHRASLAKKLEASSLLDLVDIGFRTATDGNQIGRPAPWPAPHHRWLF
jgi:FixJ family two-component response regulator